MADLSTPLLPYPALLTGVEDLGQHLNTASAHLFNKKSKGVFVGAGADYMLKGLLAFCCDHFHIIVWYNVDYKPVSAAGDFEG